MVYKKVDLTRKLFFFYLAGRSFKRLQIFPIVALVWLADTPSEPNKHQVTQSHNKLVQVPRYFLMPWTSLQVLNFRYFDIYEISQLAMFYFVKQYMYLMCVQNSGALNKKKAESSFPLLYPILNHSNVRN